MSWYLEVLKKYAVFQGRAGRKEYWMFNLFNIIIAMAIGFVTGLVEAVFGMGTILSNAASVIYSLGILVPGIAVSIRRMHDLGRSGWWILFPVVNLIFMFFDSQPGDNEYGPNPKAA
ncbi:MAG: DUF805 domain-containing protein [Methylobacter sp.]